MITYHVETIYILMFVAVLGVAFLGNSLFADTTRWLGSNTHLIYPVKKLTTLECRAMMKPWNELPESCKISFPSIYNTRTRAYQGFEQYKNIVTVLWWASYEWQRDVDKWDHAGVDIASASGTPLYSIANGIVTKAERNSLAGNTVTIMFSFQWATYHASYDHMKSIAVKKWDTVKQWQIVGELGNTGNVFGALWGNHVHFSISKDYYGRAVFAYSWCPVVTSQYVSADMINKIVSHGLCREQREMYQVDPIAFIANSQVWLHDSLINPSDPKEESTTWVSKQEVEKTEEHSVAPKEDTKREEKTKEKTKQDTINETSPRLEKKTLKLRPVPTAKLTKNAIDFLRERDVKIVAKANSKMKLNQNWEITIYVTKKSTWENFNWILPEWFVLLSSNWAIELSTGMVNYIENGEYTVTFTSKKLWGSSIAISYGWVTITTMVITSI